MYLLHAMYSLALASVPQNQIYAPGDYHYSQCKLLHDECVQNPTALDIVATHLLAMYAMQHTAAIIAGVSWGSESLRMAQQCKMFYDGPIGWKSSNGTYCKFPPIIEKQFRQMLAYVCTYSDYRMAYFRRTPLELEELDFSFMQPVEPSLYHPFYSSRIWYCDFQLLQSARKVFVFSMLTSRDPTQDLLDQVFKLQQWFDVLPQWITYPHLTYSFDVISHDPPPWRIAHMLLFYHSTVLTALKVKFLQLVESNPNHQNWIVQKVKQSVMEICRITDIMLRDNPTFQTVPTSSYQHMWLAGAFASILQIFGTTEELKWCIDKSRRGITFFCTIMPVIGRLLPLLDDFSSQPKEAISKFRLEL